MSATSQQIFAKLAQPKEELVSGLVQRILDLSLRAAQPTLHEQARNHAELSFQRVVNQFAKTVRENKKKKEEELLTLWLMLMEEEQEDLFKSTSAMLKAPSLPTGKECNQFAASRSELIAPFGEKFIRSLRDEKLSEEDTIQKAHRLEVTEGKRLSATEAQAVYGAAQLRSLRLQGYKLKAWETMEDERVRESHNLCQEQGAIPLGKPFHNGLQYPGDPNGGPEEVCNCRCNLVGVGVRS